MKLAALVLALASGLCSLAAIGLAWRGLYGPRPPRDPGGGITSTPLADARRVFVEESRSGFGWAATLGSAAAVLGMASAVVSYLDPS